MTRKEEYIALRDGAAPIQKCALCGGMDDRNAMHPHHPKGRRGENILNFCWLHPKCHAWVHDNPLKATEKGLLIPVR